MKLKEYLDLLQEQIFLNPIVHDNIFDFLTPLEILLFSRTCRPFYNIVCSYIKRVFNIDRILSRFFVDPLAFRALQARTGTLISGSSALQFFARTFYPESDLDLYIHSNWLPDVVEWIVQQGYVFVPAEGQPADWKEAAKWGRERSSFGFLVNNEMSVEYRDRSISVVLTLSKPSVVEGGPERRVQCIAALRGPMQTILSFHSTCVMNVISYENAYCLYPRGTLHEDRSLLCQATSVRNRPEALEKYRRRGFELVAGSQRGDVEYTAEHKLYLSFPVCTRYVGDPLCWTIPLNTDGFGPSPGMAIPNTQIVLPHDPVCTVSWNMEVEPVNDVGMAYETSHPPVLYLSCLNTAEGVFKSAVFEFISRHRRNQRIALKDVDDWVPQLVDDQFVEWCLKYYPQLWSMSMF